MAGTSGSQSTTRKKSSNRPNRAQMRAAEIRAAETVGTGAVAATAAVAGVGAIAVNRRSVNRHTPRAVGLSREREMAYIRGDLRRLLIIAGGLFVLMIALLLVID